MNDWFRSWHGAPTDPKWLLIGRKANAAPAVVFAVFWALCDHASQQHDRGSVATFDVETYAVFAGVDEDQIQAIVDALTDKGLIKDGRLTAWEKRQPKREDSSTERVRAHRERKAGVTDPPPTNETQCNAEEHPETLDTDTDTEEIQIQKQSTGLTLAPAKPPRERKRDPLWDQLANEMGPAPTTASGRGSWNSALKQLREAGDATPAEIHVRAERYRVAFPGAALTPPALAKFWGQLSVDPEPNTSSGGRRRKNEPDYSGLDEFNRTMDRMEAAHGTRNL